MAFTSTIYVFDLTLSDVDRGVFEELRLTLAQHPSESMDYLLMRLIAYCLEYREGIAFSHGLGFPDEPAIWAHDLTGQVQLWVDIGSPSAERLHRASKHGCRVSVYNHKNLSSFLEGLSGEKIHRAAEIQIYSVAPEFLEQLESLVQKRNKVSFSLSERVLYLEISGQAISTTIEQHQITTLRDGGR